MVSVTGSRNRRGFCSLRDGSEDTRVGLDHEAPGISRDKYTEMSSVPSCVPPNQTHKRVLSGSCRRFEAWHCTVAAGMSSTLVKSGLDVVGRVSDISN